MGKGTLSVAVFAECDPAKGNRLLPQLFMSTKYKQLSDVVGQAVDFAE